MLERIALMQLIGPFSFQLTSGESITPRSAKARGLLALLATSPDMKRPRRWLEDKLWSDRGPEQASASLRQTLSEIRRVLPKDEELMFSDRSNVSLAQNKIEVCLDHAGDAIFNEREFLEGIDVRDHEFENWLQIMRSRLHTSLGAAQDENQTTKTPTNHLNKLVVECNGNSSHAGKPTMLAEIVADQVGKNVVEQVSGYCKKNQATNQETTNITSDLNVNCTIVADDKSHLALIQVMAGKSGQVLFSRTFESNCLTKDISHNISLAKMTFDAAENVTSQLHLALGKSNNIAQASIYVQTALTKIFQFERAGLQEADHLLDQAFHLDPNGVYLAWKALIRTIQAIELFERDTDQLRIQADILLNQALSDGSSNATIFSIASLVKAMLFDDNNTACDFATLAFEENPRSAFALQAISVTKMLSGDVNGSYYDSKSGHTIAGSSRYRHWWDLYHGLVCIASQRYDEAIIHAQAAHRRAPKFRPPLRNLIALYMHFGKSDEASECQRLLRELEPDFSIAKFIECDEYPNRTLKQAGLLDSDYSDLISANAAPGYGLPN